MTLKKDLNTDKSCSNKKVASRNCIDHEVDKFCSDRDLVGGGEKKKIIGREMILEMRWNEK